MELPCAAGTAGIKRPEQRCLEVLKSDSWAFLHTSHLGGFPGAVSGTVPTCGGFFLL